MNNSWDRLGIRNEIWRLVKKHNLGMFAPRRLGKTYLMQNYLRIEAESQGWRAVYCDLQGAETCQEAVVEIVNEINRQSQLSETFTAHFKAKFRQLTTGGNADFQHVLQQTDWQTLLDAVLEGIENQNANTLLMLDEVTVCVNRILSRDPQQGRQFLDILRKYRFKYNQHIRWLLTGSIGLNHLAERHQLTGQLNDLQPVLLTPLTPAQARDFTAYFCQSEDVAQPFQLGAASHRHLQQRLGWLSPYYIEKLCLRIQPPSPPSDGLASANKPHIDKACDELLTHPYTEAFKAWPDHLQRNIEPVLRDVCHAVLRFLCTRRDGESFDVIRTALAPEFTEQQAKVALALLVDDGFLSQQRAKGRYTYQMSLLADYWAEYHH